MGVALTALALAGCGEQGGSGSGAQSGQQIHIVGSSTVYPFTTAVAEQFQRNNPGMSAIVESTGTGAGMKQFCAGVGDSFPDMTNASRRMKASEFEDCTKNGVKQVVEVPVGIDGLALIESTEDAEKLSLTVKDIYAALAANPFGKPNTAKTWKDVNPALPAVAIRVMGPPPTSGTRDSFAELILEKGCDSDPAMKALKDSDSDKHKDICTKIREDGTYIEAGENDNLLVQKVAQSPGTIGVLGYSFLEENTDKVRGIPLAGIEPNAETISSLEYPGARMLYLYVKGDHVAAVPGMKEFLAEYAKAWSAGGYLERRGLIPAPADAQAKATQAATALTPLAAGELK
ncbi:substrate-binding domain-containing protein [Sphingosinicella rhizophila]|uniref:Substrate-binding domain-containing protein n=1 Tax=Sphingosinicella rhizophila TaxID=3050082 RepID=A0ABU3Q4U6_9SPHN|nr:substrate-binding domain-containing protein [Sphingosinicella sp. GR2756]MDT9598431.1 substrate-binding domain-containing protein [Sphingosinicella sp. GR2756]